MIVIDASAIVNLLTAQTMSNRDDLVTLSMRAPQLLNVEVMSALRGLNLAGKLNDQAAWQAWTFYQQMRIIHYPLDLTAARAWQLRHQFTVYDAHYIALAEYLDQPLLTSDSKLLHGHFAQVRLLSEFPAEN